MFRAWLPIDAERNSWAPRTAHFDVIERQGRVGLCVRTIRGTTTIDIGADGRGATWAHLALATLTWGWERQAAEDAATAEREGG